MAQVGTISAIPGVVSAELYVINTDTLVATASSVQPGTNDASFYTITFNPNVTVGNYRLILRDVSNNIVGIIDSITVAVGTWSEIDATAVAATEAMLAARIASTQVQQ